MTLSHLLLLLLPLLGGILPVAEQNRAGTSRLSRGPQQPSLAELAGRPTAREAAQRAIGSRRRVAVIGRPTSADALPSWAIAEALDFEVANALRYSPQWIIDSPITVRRLVNELPAEISSAAASEIAGTLSADELVFVAIEPLEGEPDQFQIVADRWVASADGSWSAAAAVGHPVTEASRPMAAGQVALQLAPGLTSEARRELQKPGTTKNAAHSAWAAAVDHTLRAMTSDASEQMKQQAEQGLRQAERALEADPSFVAASLTAATCLEILEREAEQATLLENVYAIRDGGVTDSLTMQEFEADYARLAERNVDLAFDGYAQLLEADPTYLPAIWSLLQLVGDDDAVAVSDEDQELLGELAAMAVLAHPHSRIATLITEPEK